MGVQRVSKKDLIDEYLYRPPSPKQKKKLTKKSWRKSKKKKVDIWALSFCINHLNICITIANFNITESGVLIWFSWVLKSTISPLKKCKILTLFIYSGLLFGSFRSFYLYYLSSRGGRGGPEKVVIGGRCVILKKKIGMGSPYNCIFSVLRKVKENKESIYWTNISMCPHDTTMSQFY